MRAFKYVEINNITDDHWIQIDTLNQISKLHIEIKRRANFSVGSSRSRVVLNQIMNVVSNLTNLEEFIFEGKYSFEIDEQFYKEFIAKRSKLTLVLKSADDQYVITYLDIKKNGTTILVNSIENNAPMCFAPNGIIFDDSIELYTIVSARQITELSIVGPRIKKLAIHLGGSTKEEAHRILAEAEACGTGVRELSLQNIDTNMFFNTNIEYSFPRVEILTLENITASHEHHISPFKFECLNELIMVDPLTHGLVGLLFLVKNPIQKITIGRYDEDMDEALMHTPNVIKEKIETITIRESGLKPTKLIHSMTNHFKNLINIDLRGIDLSDVPMPLWCNIIQEWTKIESFKATFFEILSELPKIDCAQRSLRQNYNRN